MKAPGKHKYEEERLLKLRFYQMLESDISQEFDDIVNIVKQICGVPIAFLSIVADETQHIKSCVGLEKCESPRDISFCGHTILEEDGFLEIKDTGKDERFSDNPFVCNAPNIRYYFGATLISPDGYPLGTLCAVDTKPNALSEEQKQSVITLSKKIMTCLDVKLMNDDLLTLLSRVRKEIIHRKQKEKELKAALEESQAAKDKLAYLSIVASETDNPVIITDAHGRMEYVNTAFTTMTGYSKEEAIGKSPGKLLQGEETTAEQVEAFRKGLESGESFVQQIINYTKTGDKYWVLCAITPVYNEQGLLSKYISLEREITKEKEQELAMQRAKEKAEEGMKIKDQFLSNMSHEIRTPMNGIIGLTNLLKEEHLTDYQNHLINSIDQSANILLRLINDILDLSKINAEKISFEKKTFNLRALLNNLEQTFSIIAREKGIDFQVFMSSNTPDEVVGDPTRLNQILMNLINNALKFTERGFVRIEVSKKNGLADTNSIHFKVVDTGIGISESKQQSVFAEFVQADDHITRKYGGTGLGLTIAKKLVEKMGGSLYLHSIVGEGSTFSFDINFEKPDIVKRKLINEPEIESTSPSALKILVAEDNEINQLVAVKALEKMGHKVQVAQDGQEALLLHEKEHFDVILMDVQMPNMNGLDATREIRKMEDPVKSNVMIIAMTASALQSDLEKCLESGMNAHVSKPFKLSDLQKQLSEIHRKRTYFSISA